MVETMLYSNPASPQASMGLDLTSKSPMGMSRQNSSYTLSHESMTREDHRLRELGLNRSGSRTPRRSQTYADCQISTPPPPAFHLQTVLQDVHTQPPTPPIPSPLPSPVVEEKQPVDSPPSERQARRPQRPALGPPRRSYSVMHHEPLPHHHRPAARGSGGLDIMYLPSELHMAIFDFLDPIDSTCLGLTNKHFYSIHRRLHGSVPLSARRDGPNELEWAWHLHFAGRAELYKTPLVVVDGSGADEKTAEDQERERIRALTALRVRGQAYCRKCGICRCELHKHIQEWMPEGMEYCSVKRKFGPVAGEGSKEFCYLSSPRDPGRCGRHRVRKDRVELK